MRSLLRKKLSKTARHRFIELFVKHKYWYEQGHYVVAGFKVVTIMEILGVVAFCKYIFGELPIVLLISAGIVWFPLRTFCYWAIGKFWHVNNGYETHTNWNKGKVPPSRVETINAEEIGIEVAKYLRMDGQTFKEILEKRKQEKKDECT